MAQVNSMEDARSVASFSNDFEQFKQALSNSKQWAINLLNVTDALQANPLYAEMFDQASRDAIQLCEESSNRAVALVEQVQQSIAPLG